MVYIALIALIVIIVGVIVTKENEKETQRQENSALMGRIQNYYDELTEIIIDIYDLKVCPKCDETDMDLIKVSPTGKSIEYLCKNCNKKITSKLLVNKDGSKAAELLGNIRHIFNRIDYTYDQDLINREIDISFEVQPNIEKYTKLRKRTAIP